jgi:hypothetical protein
MNTRHSSTSCDGTLDRFYVWKAYGDPVVLF